jgi:hypothetical protein
MNATPTPLQHHSSVVRSLHRDQRGAIMLMGLFMACFLVGVLWYIIGIGNAIVFRDTMQEAADHSAFTAAVLHAKGMNFIAACNLILFAMAALHILFGIIFDVLLFVCIASAAKAVGDTAKAAPTVIGAVVVGVVEGGEALIKCKRWWNWREGAYKKEFGALTRVGPIIHNLEQAAAVGYPWIALARGYEVGHKGYDGTWTLALSRSLVPASILNKLGLKDDSTCPASKNSGQDSSPSAQQPASTQKTSSTQKSSSTSQVGLPVEAKHFDTICNRIGTQIDEVPLEAVYAIGNKKAHKSENSTINSKITDWISAAIRLRYCNDDSGEFSDFGKIPKEVTKLIGKVVDSVAHAIDP